MSSDKAPALEHVKINVGLDSSGSNQKVSSARLPILTAPGPNSNYIDWELVVSAYFVAVGVKYVLKEVPANQRTPTWTNDNSAVVAVLTQAIDLANLCYVRAFREDACGMWSALKKAHLDSSTGGRIYWIRKLLHSKMEGDDILAHLDTMSQSYERLNALVTPEKPLTPSEVHSAALLSSIPDDWINCVSHLMNQDDIPTETIALALKNEHT
ncbi:hypothetical protein PTTG_30903, partial [Puccinia triticina 1-1 BBBD Race 1]